MSNQLNSVLKQNSFKEEPLISVIVPVYNVEKYLAQCLDSILEQTYRNLEIIVIDDGSTDRSSEICDCYAKKDERIIVIHQDNRGISAARNVALDIMNGDYVAFADSDDWLEKDAYRIMFDMLCNFDLDMVFCTANVVEEDRIIETRFEYFPNGTIRTPDEMVADTLLDSIGGQVWLRLSSKECWNNVRFPYGRLYEDLAMSYLAFLNATKGVGFVSTPLYNYRLNKNGISLSVNPAKSYHIFMGFRDHYEYAKKNYKKLEQACLAKAALYAIGCINIYISCDENVKKVRSWLRDNEHKILKCDKLSTARKIMIELYLYVPWLYIGMYKFFSLLKKLYGVIKSVEKR